MEWLLPTFQFSGHLDKFNWVDIFHKTIPIGCISKIRFSSAWPLSPQWGKAARTELLKYTLPIEWEPAHCWFIKLNVNSGFIANMQNLEGKAQVDNHKALSIIQLTN